MGKKEQKKKIYLKLKLKFKNNPEDLLELLEKLEINLDDIDYDTIEDGNKSCLVSESYNNYHNRKKK